MTGLPAEPTKSSPKGRAKPGALKGLAQQLQGKAPVKRKTARVVVGFDFGTSTTKVVVAIDRGEGHERQALPLFGEPLFPSVVALHPGGHVELGAPPELSRSPQDLDARGVRVVRSLKMRLREALLDGQPERHVDHFPVVPIAAVVWAYLVRVVAEVERQLVALLPDAEWDRHVVWHLGVPMSGSRHSRLEQAFRELLYRAVHYPDRAELPPHLSVADVARRYAEAVRLPCPPPATSDCLAFAEAAVAVSAIQLQRRLEPGHYFICDVGAGTTDLAFFWYSHLAQDTPVNFYSTECEPCGGDRFFKALLEVLRRTSRRPLTDEQAHAEVRARLHARGASSQRELDPFLPILDQLALARRRAFQVALRRKEEIDNWRQVTGFLVGGAAAMPGVRDRLRQGLETFVKGDEISVYLRPLDLHHEIQGATPLHWIALGLSQRSQTMEAYSPPESTPRFRTSGLILRPPPEERDDTVIK